MMIPPSLTAVSTLKCASTTIALPPFPNSVHLRHPLSALQFAPHSRSHFHNNKNLKLNLSDRTRILAASSESSNSGDSVRTSDHKHEVTMSFPILVLLFL